MSGSNNAIHILSNTNPFRKSTARPASVHSLSGAHSYTSAVSSTDHQAHQFINTNRPCPKKAHRHSASVPNHHSGSAWSTSLRPDIIDRLDDVSFVYYHHEGPYDAVYAERNYCSQRSPIEALKESNEEAIKATPRYKLTDSIERHRPLDGVAFYPPGATDFDGHTYQYTEGANMMTELEGNFSRDPGMKFTKEDFANDPFYADQHQGSLRRIGSLRKALSFRRRRRNNTS